ncbi:MAG: hypothetical protein Q7S74_01110 [Nanoarchaeota archaeon]|nr:hypothetical protein [Nanoarchaeota archaeon]
MSRIVDRDKIIEEDKEYKFNLTKYQGTVRIYRSGWNNSCWYADVNFLPPDNYFGPRNGSEKSGKLKVTLNGNGRNKAIKKILDSIKSNCVNHSHPSVESLLAKERTEQINKGTHVNYTPSYRYRFH